MEQPGCADSESVTVWSSRPLSLSADKSCLIRTVYKINTHSFKLGLCCMQTSDASFKTNSVFTKRIWVKSVNYSVEPDTSDNLLKNEWCARNCSSSTVHLSQSPQTPVLKLYSENKHIYSLLQQPGLVSMETIFLTTVSCLTRIKTKRLLWV